jgi:Zn-finger nucleic acid-binding protein
MKCPNCSQKELEPTQVSGYPVEIDYCLGCDGIWLDGGELNRILDAPDPDFRLPAGAARSLKLCPKCRRIMYSFFYPRTFVTVDMCKQCHGVWLDKGEFEEIDSVRKMTKTSGMVKSAAAPAAKAPPTFKERLIEFIDNRIRSTFDPFD